MMLMGQVSWRVWRDFSSLYSRFYEVIILESINAIDEGKMQMYF
jgi:hypothetical protein